MNRKDRDGFVIVQVFAKSKDGRMRLHGARTYYDTGEAMVFTVDFEDAGIELKGHHCQVGHTLGKVV